MTVAAEISVAGVCVSPQFNVMPVMIEMTKYFTPQKLGPLRSLTPAGFLVCRDVPIARCGSMDYAEHELPEIDAKDGVITVERGSDELLCDLTIASFEGMPVTQDHPDDPVSAENWREHAIGHAQNVRRGTGDQSELLLADLVITDAKAVRELQGDDLPEVSAGYDAEYVQVSPGRAEQRQIVGNHIALVRRGRCGPICSIGDGHMADKKTAQTSFRDRMRKLFMTRDSEGFEKALEDAPEPGGDEGGAQHIHVHLPGAAKPDDEAAASAKPVTTNDDEIGAAIAEALKPFDERMARLEDIVMKLAKAGEPDGDEPTTDDEADEADEDDEGNRPGKSPMTTDSAGLADEAQDTRARAEILSPGIKFPTMDAAPAKARESLCLLRRRALRAAQAGDHAGIVNALLPGKDISRMTCDALAPAFIAASEMVKAKMSHGAPQEPSHAGNWAEQVNARNAEFWARK